MKPKITDQITLLLTSLALLISSAVPTHAHTTDQPPSPYNSAHCEHQLDPVTSSSSPSNLQALAQWQHAAEELAATATAQPDALTGALIHERNDQLTKLAGALSHQELLAQATLTINALETEDPAHQYLPGLLPGITYSNNLAALIQNYLDIQIQINAGDIHATTPDLRNVLGNLLTPINITLSALKTQTNERIVAKYYGIYLERALATAVLAELRYRLDNEPDAILNSLK